ncbi:hypothetical protein AWL63_24115 (plasmid) [Sphingomonas panacis]|uniref:DUF1173 domain-containing protein n=1 Tax=Sphingomonas panacis TaxID=1560345 RepID=A0A1B3ZII6_9SPHN|nr:hypothetical protein [Sphingomonas panacis]AOH87245.1 hypothetical protein AWL63_24115 [Sphingomonas panacis]
MWLIDRYSDGLGRARIPLPRPLRAALVRWYVGDGSRSDEEAGIMLVQQARIGEKWIACDCLGNDREPPILTPAFLSEAETYYLRRLTGSKRAEHLTNCPFFRDQATNRISEVRNPETPADPPVGYFEVLRPAPEKLAQRPDEDSSDDRTRNASMPRLARLLWRLLNASGLNRSSPISEEPPERSITQEFKALSAAAARIEIAPGVELSRALWTHARALHTKRAFASIRELAREWPRGHAPQGFLTVFAQEFRGSTIYPAGSEPISVANRIQSPSVRGNRIKGPFLIIVVIGEYPEAHGYAPLRAYAQPIFSGNRFVPVESEFERNTLRALLGLRHAFDRDGIDIAIEKPVFDILTPLGACRPDFLLEARSRHTGEVRQLIVEAMGFSSDEYRASKTVTHPRMAQIAPVVGITPEDLEAGRLGGILAEKLAG